MSSVDVALVIEVTKFNSFHLFATKMVLVGD